MPKTRPGQPESSPRRQEEVKRESGSWGELEKGDGTVVRVQEAGKEGCQSTSPVHIPNSMACYSSEG